MSLLSNGPATRGQVVDTETAQEFLKESLGLISREEMAAIAGELEIKSQRLRDLLIERGVETLSQEDLRRLLRSVFASRRRVDLLLASVEALRQAMSDLLGGQDPVPLRLERFSSRFESIEGFFPPGLGTELLHFTEPEEHWLWTRWIWNPATETGALPLLVMEEHDLHADGVAQGYLRVGEALRFVEATGEAAGFTPDGRGPFGLDVFLACVYGVYLYTVLRLRMTQEFNKVVPPLPELSRRLLGVHGMEI